MNRPLAALLLCGSSAVPLIALAQAAVTPVQVLDRVTVSARLREEDLTEVPASIAVVDGEALKQEGRFNIGDLDSRVSNLQLGDLNGSPIIYLRGVGGGGRNVGFEPRTGITVDGVFLNAPPMSNALLLDLERVEVVRGPQGSLSGQNTVAGSIQMITRKPGKDFSIEALARSDSQQTRRLASAINLPLADGRVRTRLSVSLADGAGEVTNRPTGERADAFKDAAVRARTLVLLRDDLTLDLSADTAAHFDDFPTGEPTSGTGGSGPPVPPGPYSIAVNSPQRNDVRQSGLSATLSYQIPQGRFTSITAWRDTQRDWLIDLDYSAADILLVDFFDEYSRFSQELRFASTPQAIGFSWLAGLYAFEQVSRSERNTLALSQVQAVNPMLQPGDRIDTRPRARNRSLAAYGSVGFGPIERLRVDAGLRGVFADRQLDYQQLATAGFQRVGFANTAETRQRDEETVLLPDLAVSWAWQPTLTSYARYARGSKSGGYDADTLTGARSQPDRFDTETVDSLELGLKGSAWRRRAQANLAAFVAEYRDYQVSQFRPVGTVFLPVISNAGKVRVYGPELEMGYRSDAGYRLQTSTAWLHSEYVEFGNGGAGGVDFSGRRTEFAPQWSHSSALEKAWAVDRGGVSSFSAALSFAYRSRYFTQPSNRDLFRAEARELLGAKVRLTHQSGRAHLTLFGENLLDDRYTNSLNQATLGTIYGRFGASRTIGVQLELAL